ncbi:MAG: hypothetical protein NTY77_01465 [Elusimicrobia bacterium]|nr:hypothetical protein [Elusimicrobiota bacterium]
MSMLRRGATLVALLLLAAATSYAQKKEEPKFSILEVQAAQEDPKAYTIDEASIRIQNLGPVVSPKQIGLPENKNPAKPGKEPFRPGPDGGSDGPDPLVLIDQIINLGQKIWAIVEANKPVVNIQTQYGTATPKGVDHWTQLAGWKAPEGTVYGFSAKNAYGATVINVRYQVLRTCGGNYNGKGKYLTAVTIDPLTVDVLWGYKFNLSVEIPDSSIANAGTTENPVAAMQPLVKWTIATVIKESNGRSSYYVRGDGLFQETGGPFARNYEDGVAKALDNAAKSQL